MEYGHYSIAAAASEKHMYFEDVRAEQFRVFAPIPVYMYVSTTYVFNHIRVYIRHMTHDVLC